ncbi:MAG TPA: Crp/Fnr family transcriptional regulator [Ohtaekwangia sp.]|nr:Crp/Fnr family transcriptional regulator [Ohtaekwangia sp.]
MNTELILQNVSKHIDITKQEEDLFISLLQPKSIKRKQRTLEEGDICKYSSFVIEGCLKAFSVDKDGIEHVLNFACPGWWIADMYSLISHKPAILNIEAIVDSEVLMLSRDDQQQLFKQVPKFERFFRILVENSLVANHQRLINNMSLTAEERYLDFLHKYPSLLEFAPLHSIASYLGITPEFLSRIRARLAKSK